MSAFIFYGGAAESFNCLVVVRSLATILAGGLRIFLMLLTTDEGFS